MNGGGPKFPPSGVASTRAHKSTEVRGTKPAPPAENSAPPPDAPVPSAARKAQAAPDAEIGVKQDKMQREALSTLNSDLQGLAGNDVEGVRKALDKAKNMSPRADVKQTLERLSQGLGDHTD